MRNSFVFYRRWRRDFYSTVVILSFWLAVSLPRFHGPIDLRWDASTYYILGTSLAEGKGYRLLNEPGNIRAVQYPPLLPMLVALHQRLLGSTDFIKVGHLLRLTYFILSGIYLLAVYLLGRQILPPLPACFVGAATALSFNSFFYPSETLYADLPFAFAAILFLICHRRGGRSYDVATGAFAWAAYLLRTAGIVLLVSWVLESLIRRRWNQAILRAVIAAIPVLAWQGYIWHVTRSADYRQPHYSYQRAPYYYPNVTYSENSVLRDPFEPEQGRSTISDICRRVGWNIIAVPVGLAESSWFGRPLLRYPLEKLSRVLPYYATRSLSAALNLGLVAVGLLALAGSVLTLRRGEWFLTLYFGLTVALVILTPWQSQFWRYLSPIAPLTLIFMVVSLLRGTRLLRQRFAVRPAVTKRLIGTAAMAMLSIQAWIAVIFLHGLRPVSYYDAQGREHSSRLLTYEPHWHALDRAFEWIRQKGRPDAVLATSVPQLAYLRSQHKAVLPPFVSSPTRAMQLLDEVPVSYLVLDQLGRPPISQRYAADLVASRPESWKLVFTAPGTETQVYERIR